jgi:hypothetical protein
MVEELTPYGQKAYLLEGMSNDALINKKATDEYTRQGIELGMLPKPKDPYAQPWGQVAGGGQGPGRGWMLAPKSAGGGGYDPGPGPQAIVPTYMMPYKKTPKNNLNKTTNQIRAAIYTLKKPKDLTKSQKIVIAEMFGKQIVTKPIKNQNKRR